MGLQPYGRMGPQPRRHGPLGMGSPHDIGMGSLQVTGMGSLQVTGMGSLQDNA